MKLLFGIQGTGNGHVSRSTQVIDRLLKLGAQVDVLFSGCREDKIYERDVIKSAMFCKGFTFITQSGSIQLADTLRNLSFFRFARDVHAFDAGGYDLVITDFEPVTAMIAKFNHLPSIGIGHQYAFAYDIPMDGHSLLPLWILRYFAPARYTVGMHWHHFNQPIIPPKVKLAKEVDPGHILVYLPFESRSDIRSLLEPFSGCRFSIYAPGRIAENYQDGHLMWHSFSKDQFYQDLGNCSGVICNAGFELPSEALSLGKKLLVKPLIGQFEQGSNALALKQLNLGRVMGSLSPVCVEKWLDDAAPPKLDFPDVADLLARWIIQGNWSRLDVLVEKNLETVTRLPGLLDLF